MKTLSYCGKGFYVGKLVSIRLPQHEKGHEWEKRPYETVLKNDRMVLLPQKAKDWWIK